jgi:ABC-type sugar transport system ATPase subunit
MEEAELVIMDEPTAALGVSQTEMVLDLVKQLRDRGIAVLIISHNLNDVFAVADIIAVLYLGRLARSGPVEELDSQSVVELITTGSTSQSPATQNTATQSTATQSTATEG